MANPEAAGPAHDVLIVGGGMVGLTLAVALAGAGLRVAVVDRTDPTTLIDAAHDGRTSAIAHGSRVMLQGLGVWSRMAAAACPIDDIRVSDGPSRLFLHYDHRDVGDDPLGYIVENRDIRMALLAQLQSLASLDLHAPARVTSLSRDPDGVVAVLDDGTALAAALVIGADGRASPLRSEVGIVCAEWRYPQTSIVCTVGHARPHRNIAHERFLPAGPFAILPMTDDPAGRHRSSIVWTEAASLAPALLALPAADFTVELARPFGDFLGALTVLGHRWSYPLSLLHAERYTDRRLALVGDAAHAIHPIAGQGLNMGLRDVAALAEILVDTRRLGLDIGAAPVLARYQRWRRFDNTVLMFATDGLNRLFSNDLAPLRLARDIGLAAVNATPPLKRLLMRHAMGVVGDLPRLIRGEPL